MRFVQERISLLEMSNAVIISKLFKAKFGFLIYVELFELMFRFTFIFCTKQNNISVFSGHYQSSISKDLEIMNLQYF